MSDEQTSDPRQTAASDPSLAGAVPLDSKVAQGMRRLLAEAAPHKPVAMVGVVLGEDGRLSMTAEAPGGVVQVLGLLAFGTLQIGSQLQQQGRPGPNVP